MFRSHDADVSPRLSQQRHDLRLLELERIVERRIIESVLLVDGCSFFEQESNDVHVSVAARDVQRRSTVVVAHVEESSLRMTTFVVTNINNYHVKRINHNYYKTSFYDKSVIKLLIYYSYLTNLYYLNFICELFLISLKFLHIPKDCLMFTNSTLESLKSHNASFLSS